jgi:hypothetical protein
LKHIMVLNLTYEKLDDSFSLLAEMSDATVSFGWKNGAPLNVSDPDSSVRTQKVIIPVISDLLSEKLQGFSLEKIMSLELFVIGGNTEITHWISYLCGKWNITCTFWHEKLPNIYSSETIRPGNDVIQNILAI